MIFIDCLMIISCCFVTDLIFTDKRGTAPNCIIVVNVGFGLGNHILAVRLWRGNMDVVGILHACYRDWRGR